MNAARVAQLRYWTRRHLRLMGSYLADTNLLLRLADPNSEQHAVATQALARLLGQGNEVYLTPQNFIEFWPWRLVPWKGTASDGPANGPQKKLLICRNVFRYCRILQKYSLAGSTLCNAFPSAVSEFTTPAWSPCFRLMLLSTWFRSILRTSPRSHSFHRSTHNNSSARRENDCSCRWSRYEA